MYGLYKRKLHKMCDLSRGITHLLLKSELLPGEIVFPHYSVWTSCIKCVICLGESRIYCSKVSFYQGNRVSALFGMDKLHQMCDLFRGITHLLLKSELLPGKSCFRIIRYGQVASNV